MYYLAVRPTIIAIRINFKNLLATPFFCVTAGNYGRNFRY